MDGCSCRSDCCYDYRKLLVSFHSMGCNKFRKHNCCFYSSLVSLAYALYNLTVVHLLSLIPSLLILSTNFAYTNDVKSAVAKVASAIGLNNANNTKTRYKYSKLNSLVKRGFRFLMIWFTFSLLLWFNDAFELSIICSVLLLAALNATVFRFADEQSIYIAMF